MLRAGRIERAGVVYTATTFPAIAAYRELARTGDVEAFAARDTRPVTVEYTLQAMDDGAAEVTELELSDEARAGLQVRRETLGEVK